MRGQEDTPLVGTKETTHVDSIGQLVSQDKKTGRVTWKDPVVRLGEFVTGAEEGVTWMSHHYTDGVIRAWHHQGALCERQRLQDHARMLTCVVQEVQ